MAVSLFVGIGRTKLTYNSQKISALSGIFEIKRLAGIEAKKVGDSNPCTELQGLRKFPRCQHGKTPDATRFR